MRSLALAAVLALAPAAALAGGYAVPNVGPRDLAMAGSAHAAQVDAGATFANPAALARIDGLSLSLGGALIDNRSNFRSLTDPGVTSGQYVHPAFPPALWASFGAPISGDLRFGVGVGVTVPFGGNVFWPAGWPGRFDILTVNRRIHGTFLTGGLQLAKWARVGGGFIWYRGTEELTQNIPWGGVESEARLATAGDSFSYDVSLELQPIEPLRLAFDYKHKSDMRLTGDATFGAVPAPFAAVTPDQGVSHDLTMPNYLAVGAAYQVSPALLVTGSFTWDRFRVYDKDAFVGTNPSTPPIVVQRNYRNGYTYRLGAEVMPVARLKVRAGVLRDISPTPPEWLSPTIPDSNVWAASVGVGYTVIKGLDVNVAYFHAFFEEVTTPAAGPGGTYNVLPATYKPYANIASIGVSWAPSWFASRAD